jgi:hypothetical protein
MASNTAEKPAVPREVRKWKSRANAAIRHVRSHFGSPRLEVPLTWQVENDTSRRQRVT